MSAKIKVTEKVFNSVKKLTASGATIPECSEVFGLAHATISRIRAASDYETFFTPKNPVPAPQKPPEVKPVSITVQATHYVESELRKTNELLTGISAKLAFIIDELCGVKTNDAKPDN